MHPAETGLLIPSDKRGNRPSGFKFPHDLPEVGPPIPELVSDDRWICLRRVNAAYEIRRFHEGASRHV
jgi:hypothetical protein